MPCTQFEKLEIYQLSEKLADAVWDIVLQWDPFARSTIGIQLVRAADSIGANLAEGTGRGSPRDLKRFVWIARGSMHEIKHWLRRAYHRRLLTTEQVQHLQPILDELAPRLNAYLKSIKVSRLQPRTTASNASEQQRPKGANHK